MLKSIGYWTIVVCCCTIILVMAICYPFVYLFKKNKKSFTFFYLKVKGFIRCKVYNFCPKCNSDAPELYECNICKWNIIPANERWELFLEELESKFK